MSVIGKDQDNQGYCQKLITNNIYSLYFYVTGNVNVELVDKVCDVNLRFWPQSALLHSYQHIRELRMLGKEMKKRLIIIFSALIIVSVNQSHKIILS